MTVFVISDVTVSDAAAFDVYRTRAAASIEAFGGRYVVRGGKPATLEGSWRPHAIVIVEFENRDQVDAWYASAAYASALEVRDTALSRDLILVDGVD